MSNEDQGTLGPADAPQVAPDTKFRRGGFRPAAEVIAEAEAAGSASPAAAEEAAADPALAAAVAADLAINYEQPEGVTYESEHVGLAGMQAAEDAEPQAPLAEEPQAAESAETKIRIGGREFSSQREAWAYAEQLEQERLAADAFRQGVEAATKLAPGNPAPEAAAPPREEEIDQEYYTNPAAYWAKREQQILAKAESRVQESMQRRESHERTWGEFYNENPDLGHVRELVDLTLQQNWQTLQHVETKAALKTLADKVRGKLKPYAEAHTPKVALPRVKTAASPGGAAGVTPQKTEAKPLNFTQQMQKLRKKAHVR